VVELFNLEKEVENMKRWQGCIALSILLLVDSQVFAVEIADCKVQLGRLELDAVVIERIEVFLEGNGAESVVIGIRSERRKANVEEGKATFYRWEVRREIGQESFVMKVVALDPFGEAVARKDHKVAIPTVSLGGTVPRAKGNISWMPIQIKESKIAVEGPFIKGYYTFSAKCGWKFIILEYEIQNIGTRPEEAFYPEYGEIATGSYIYPAWEPPAGLLSKGYVIRESTPQEVKELIGDRAEKRELLPGETARSCVVFEIPENEEPMEIKLNGIFPIISLGKKPPTPEEVAKEEMRSLLKSLSQRFPDLEPDELLTLFNELLKELWPSWEEG